MLSEPEVPIEALNLLMQACGHAPRPVDIWQRVLAHSAWHLAAFSPSGTLVGFLRATSDRALNANLFDVVWDPADPARSEVLDAMVHVALAKLRRELGGCSISLSAPPEVLPALTRVGFQVDPGGIRAMGLSLNES